MAKRRKKVMPAKKEEPNFWVGSTAIIGQSDGFVLMADGGGKLWRISIKDGYDLSAPEPSGNRSHSYRHSYYIGRAEKLGLPMISGRELERHAEDAIAADEYGQ